MNKSLDFGSENGSCFGGVSTGTTGDGELE